MAKNYDGMAVGAFELDNLVAVKGNPPCEIIAAAVISAPSEETSRLVKEEEEKHHK